MKRILVIALSLCSITIGCRNQEDTETTAMWLQPDDLKPAASRWQPAAIPAECNDIIASRTEASRMLRSQPICIDGAVASLERFARADPAALNELAVGYVLRAQREDRPSDLLNALDAAQHAVAASPQSAVARFNLAMIEEYVGLTDDAIDSWKQFLKIGHTAHAPEARDHLNRLQSFDPTERWAKYRMQLLDALRSNDRARVARLIAPFPSSAEKYLEENLLRAEHVHEAKLLASELSRLTGDRFPVDVVERMERFPAELKEAHMLFADARNADRAIAERQIKYLNAAELLERGGSPLSIVARLGYIVAVSLEHKPDSYARATALIDSIDRAARTHGYLHLLAHIRATRANFLFFQSHYVESLADSQDSVAEYERDGDGEGVSDTHMRRIGVFRRAGLNDLSWREGTLALQTAAHLAETRGRHSLYGELAQTAAGLGHAPIALLYQNTAVQIIQRAIQNTPPDEVDAIKGLIAQLSPVLRSRATIELQLEQTKAAAADLSNALRLGLKNVSLDERRIFQARIQEVQGQAFLRINPTGAIASFTAALNLASSESRTYRASLLAQRADAQRRAGRADAEENDLVAAVHELRAEQLYMLEHRKRGDAENMWSSYFSRFGEAYQTLIRQLADKGEKAAAFDYAEQARAFEPLYLVSEVVPNDFDGKTKALAEIQQALPAGTELIEYSVLPDQTIVWLISQHDFSMVRLPAGKATIERHASELQRAVGARNLTDFEAKLNALYDVLMATPLAAMVSKPRRLVIVPDGPMHGLPFAALRNANTKRYLIEGAPIEIAGSANLYLVSLTRDHALQSTAAPSVLLVGDPAFNGNLPFAQGLLPLPRARSECEKISALYAPGAQMLLDRDATIPRFLEQARTSTIIHVAAHSIVNAQAPSRSYILLAPSPNERGPLEAQALLTRLSLDHARLVVLSTCSSAGGLPVGAEGVAPFVRPLIGAGVPAVVGTLWNVEDATAEDLLVSFHRYYREGDDAAVALQRAQIGLLTKTNNKPGLRPVFAWAPFQVIGHSSSPFAPAPQHKEKPP
ncbi:MAG TPA: CHAT domain-containing protein [Thermoanaerobaculia bacterium]|nr:CHAT domain-containing protein [Thermoanaerobaculia bacterium]